MSRFILEPNEPGKGYEFINAVTGGAIPKEFIPRCRRRVSRALCRAVYLQATTSLTSRSRFTMVRITKSTPPKWHSRSPVLWHSRKLCAKADPVLTEPIMKVTVITPDDYLGDVIGDLNSRRGQIQSHGDHVTGAQQINALCSAVRDVRLCNRASVPERRVVVSTPWSPAISLQVPKNIQEEIIKARGKKD